MKFLDPTDPFYKPLWRRVAITIFCLGWALFEVSLGSLGWAALFGGLGLYCAYHFFLAFPSDTDDDDGTAT